MSRDAPHDRRWSDRDGTRRASVEFGGKGPGRKLRDGKRRTSMRGHEGRGARLGRRLGAVGRFGSKHRGSLLMAFGAVGIALSAGLALVGFEIAVMAVSGLVSLGIVVVGGLAHVHDRSHTMHRDPNVRNPPWSERRTMTNNRRNGGFFDGTPYPQPGSVHVTSHDRDTGQVRHHTRSRPGQAKAS